MDDIDNIFYPIIYFCRGGVSDKDWIIKMMGFIPEDKRVEISNEYMTIFCGAPDSPVRRKEANIYLHSQAKKYREMNNGKQ
jgi:hypothetical protein